MKTLSFIRIRSSSLFSLGLCSLSGALGLACSDEGPAVGRGSLGGARATGDATGLKGEKNTPCASDKDCSGSGQLCDFERHTCAACVTDSDCSDGAECKLGACNAVTQCENSLGCGADEVCVKAEGEAAGVCLECAVDADCDAGKACGGGHCETSCVSDKDCTDQSELCDLKTGFCAECVITQDCADSEACFEGACVSATCQANVSTCAGDHAATCRPDGLGFLAPSACDDCSTDDGSAFCGDDPYVATAPKPPIDDKDPAGSTGGSGSMNPPGALIPNGDFSAGATGWHLPVPGGSPTISGGQVCLSATDFTLGWPAPESGLGLRLEPGSYTFAFSLSVSAADDWGSVEAKIAGANPPYTPVLLSKTHSSLAFSDKSYSYDFTVDEAKTNLGLAFNVSQISGEVCIDNVMLTKN